MAILSREELTIKVNKNGRKNGRHGNENFSVS